MHSALDFLSVSAPQNEILSCVKSGVSGDLTKANYFRSELIRLKMSTFYLVSVSVNRP